MGLNTVYIGIGGRFICLDCKHAYEQLVMLWSYINKLSLDNGQGHQYDRRK